MQAELYWGLAGATWHTIICVFSRFVRGSWFSRMFRGCFQSARGWLRALQGALIVSAMVVVSVHVLFYTELQEAPPLPPAPSPQVHVPPVTVEGAGSGVEDGYVPILPSAAPTPSSAPAAAAPADPATPSSISAPSSGTESLPSAPSAPATPAPSPTAAPTPSSSPSPSAAPSAAAAAPAQYGLVVAEVRDMRDRERGLPEPPAPVPARTLASEGPNSPRIPARDDPAFKAALSKVAVRNTVMLGIGDSGFLPMIRNFIATSVLPMGLRNYLVVALTGGMCERLYAAEEDDERRRVLRESVECWLHPNWQQYQHAKYGTPKFAELVNVKSDMVLESVRLGYHTLLVDGDIVFLQNPFPVLMEQSPNAEAGVPKWDVQIQDDAEGNRNSGFMLVKASPWGIVFIAEAVQDARDNARRAKRQQPAVNDALVKLAGQWAKGGSNLGEPLMPPPNHRPPTPASIRVLDTKRFPCGKAYFERPRRMFADDHPCFECVLQHNNWIVGTKSKVFRFRESLQWLVDEPKGWYSDPSRRFLQYDGAAAGASKQEEVQALEQGFRIAKALDRVLILPSFRCHKCRVEGLGGTQAGCSGSPSDADRCSFAAHFHVETFDAFRSKGYPWREHMFRFNPLTIPQARLSIKGLPGWNSRHPDLVTAQAGTIEKQTPDEPILFLAHPDQPTPTLSSPFPEKIRSIQLPGGSTHVTQDQIVSLLKPFEDHTVLHLAEIPRGLKVQLQQEEAFKRDWAKAIKASSVRQY